MYVDTKQIEITFNEDDMRELNSMLYDAIRGIKETIKTHYNTLQDTYDRGLEYHKGVFLEQKGKEIYLIQELIVKVSCNRDIKKELLDFLEEDYKEKHKED